MAEDFAKLRGIYPIRERPISKMLCLHSCGTFEPVQRETNEPVAVWYAPDVDNIKAGLYVIV